MPVETLPPQEKTPTQNQEYRPFVSSLDGSLLIDVSTWPQEEITMLRRTLDEQRLDYKDLIQATSTEDRTVLKISPVRRIIRHD